MPICIECSCPVSHLYTSYSKADDHSLGKGVRLTQCPRCKRFADKYVEHDYVVLFIDLVLIKPQVYRHLLFNRLSGDNQKLDRSIIRLGILLLLFDVYLTWARIEKSSSLASMPISNAPIVLQYFFFFTLNFIATAVHHLTVRLLASVLVPWPTPSIALNETARPSTPPVPTTSSQIMTTGLLTSPRKLSRPPSRQEIIPNLQRPPPPVPSFPPPFEPSNSPPPFPPPLPPPLRRVSTAQPQILPLSPPSPASPNAISTALFVSSCAKLFPILLVIWGAEGNDVSGNTTAEAGNMAAIVPIQQTAAAASALPASSSELAPSITPIASPLPISLSSLLTRFSPFPTIETSSWNFHSLLSFLSLSSANTYLVLLNNIEALYILLNCGYLRAVLLAVAGQVARWSVEKLILGLFGLE